jgi:hypothetical protein
MLKQSGANMQKFFGSFFQKRTLSFAACCFLGRMFCSGAAGLRGLAIISCKLILETGIEHGFARLENSGSSILLGRIGQGG